LLLLLLLAIDAQAERRYTHKNHTTFLPASFWVCLRTNYDYDNDGGKIMSTTHTRGNKYRSERAHKTNWKRNKKQNKISNVKSCWVSLRAVCVCVYRCL